MSNQNLFLKLSNPIIAALLRSPLHGLLSASTMLVTVRGRKSGKAFTTPVNYIRQGNVLYTLSARQRSWWRNLREGAEVYLVLQGKEIQGKGTVIETDQGVAEALAHYIKLAPGFARYLGIRIDKQGEPDTEDLLSSARSRVMVLIDIE